MGNTKSLDTNSDTPIDPVLEEKTLSSAVSDNALNKKSSPNMTADLKKKKFAESNKSLSSIDGKKQSILSNSQKQILKYCINNSKEDLGERIFRRVADKNSVFKEYIEGLAKAEKTELTDGLRQFIIKVVENCDNDLEKLCREFGQRYAHLDFKPDFVQIANSLTTECVFLDAAAHPTTETLSAWSQLTSFVFGYIRDGYYCELRRLRRVSNTSSNKELEDQPKEEITADDEQVFSKSGEVSPNDESQLNRVKSEPAQFLELPPPY